MLPKKRKLHKSEFPEIISKGRTFHTSHLYARVVFDDTYTRVAFVVPKKVAKEVILRNKIKRRGYNILKKIEIKPLRGIFFAKKGIEKLSFEKMKGEIVDVLSKV